MPVGGYQIGKAPSGAHGLGANLHLPTDQIEERRSPAAIGYVLHVDTGHHLEQLTRHMGRSPVAARRHVDFARVGLRISHELGDRSGRKRWMNHHDLGLADDACYRREIADQIKIELVIECRIEGVAGPKHEERVAVRR